MTTIPTQPTLFSRLWRAVRRRLRLLDLYSQLSGAHADLASTQMEIDDLEPAQFSSISPEAKAMAFKQREEAKQEAMRCLCRIDMLNQEIHRLQQEGF